MRVRRDVRILIDQAADLTGKNRTEFILDAAHLAAQNAVLDQTVLRLPHKAYSAFLELLDAPPRTNARLRKTLLTKPEWD